MRMARFSFAIPLVRDFYFVLIGVFIVLCIIAFLVLCFLLMCCYGVINDNNNDNISSFLMPNFVVVSLGLTLSECVKERGICPLVESVSVTNNL